MSAQPELRFLSLFVPDVEQAAKRYERVLGVSPIEYDGTSPHPHPFSAATPVLFDLGGVKLALYEANPDRGTHPGDVGIGVMVHPSPVPVAERATANGGRVIYGPKRGPGDGRELLVFMLPDRHFFELIGPRASVRPK